MTTGRSTALAAVTALTLAACSTEAGDAGEQLVPSASTTTAASTTLPNETALTTHTTLHLTVGATALSATLADNTSAQALVELLADGPITIEMRDFEGMEKVGPLPTSLPTNDERITTQAGDLILYQGDKLVIYYAPNTWTFTQLGRIDDVTAEELKRILGDGDAEVTLSHGTDQLREGRR